MKKSILKQMADAGSRIGEGTEVETVPNSVSSRRQSQVISNVGRTLTHLSEDSILTLDPNKIERSPFTDRFENDVETNEELETLKISIASEGQKIPVLVRPHPTKTGQYQLAYGYRRLAAIKALNSEELDSNTLKIKAYVRELSDKQLIEEQSLENGLREGLTWIEQAMWSLQLKSVGLSQRAICPILGLTEAAISHFSKVTSNIPDDIIYKIGRAKSIGRPKWTALAELIQDGEKIDVVRDLITTNEFIHCASQERFAMVFDVAKGRSAAQEILPSTTMWAPTGKSVSVVAKVKDKATSLEFADAKGKAFAFWINTNLDDLYGLFEAYEESDTKKTGD